MPVHIGGSVVMNILYVNLFLFAFFTVIYWCMDFKKHFNFPATTDPHNFVDTLYFSAVTHTSTGFGDITPKTSPAKLLVLSHALVVFISFILLTADGICKFKR